MKNPKKPTLKQKKLIVAAGLRWTNWLVTEENDEELKVINKVTKTKRTIKK